MRSAATTIPFIKDNQFDYAWLLSWLVDELPAPDNRGWSSSRSSSWIVHGSLSNGANLTDGIERPLPPALSAISWHGLGRLGLTLSPSNTVIADYLHVIMSVPGPEEPWFSVPPLSARALRFCGATRSLAQVFVGDTGSLRVGRHHCHVRHRHRGRSFVIPVLSRDFPHRKPRRGDSSGVVSLHQEEARRGPPGVPHGAPSPPLPETEHA